MDSIGAEEECMDDMHAEQAVRRPRGGRGPLWQDGRRPVRGGGTRDEARTWGPLAVVFKRLLFLTLRVRSTPQAPLGTGASFASGTQHDPWNSKCSLNEGKA